MPSSHNLDEEYIDEVINFNLSVTLASNFTYASLLLSAPVGNCT